MSMPISFIAAIASGRTSEGFVPAENTSKRSPASWRNNPSAIWLRAELPVHRINTRFLAVMDRLLLSLAMGPAMRIGLSLPPPPPTEPLQIPEHPQDGYRQT